MGKYIVGLNSESSSQGDSLKSVETTNKEIVSVVSLESNRSIALIEELLLEQKKTNKLLRKIYNPE